MCLSNIDIFYHTDTTARLFCTDHCLGSWKPLLPATFSSTALAVGPAPSEWEVRLRTL